MQTITTTSIQSVLNCSTVELIEIIKIALRTIDDCEQIAGDNGDAEAAYELNQAYNEFELIFKYLRGGGILTIPQRNSLRMTLKHYYKITSNLLK